MTVFPGMVSSLLGQTSKLAAAGTGTTQAAGTSLTAGLTQFSTITGASADSATLRSDWPELKPLAVFNTSGTTMNIFPHSGGKINEGSTDAAVTLATAKCRVFWRLSSTQWFSMLGA